MIITLPEIVKQSINKLGNKTAKASGLKIYTALFLNEKRKNNQGYFPVPSTYLESVNKRYNRAIKQFIDDGIICYFKNVKQDPNDLFNTIETKYYNRDKGICMKYKFLIDITDGEETYIDFRSTKHRRWYTITYNSLLDLGFEPNINRDSFGRRVHHNITQDYKELLHKEGYYVIDSETSQPRLLWLLMKKNNITDQSYNNIFENNIDFYDYLVVNLNLADRKEAKDLFMFWLNSSGYVPNFKIHCLFPQASQYIKSLKNKWYKDSASFLQREEAKIWIDDLLENIPTKFALTIHDSLIIKKKDLFTVLEYCKSKYPELKFNCEEL